LIVRFAIVGLGHIGRRHATLIAAHPRAVLVGIADVRSEGKLDWPPELPRRPPVFSSVDDLLAGVESDVVCICTPNGLHAEQGLQCLTAGRHVVIEKPLALTVEECDRLIATAQRYDRQVFGVMQNRFSPASAWLHETVGSGRLGNLLQVHLDCFWNRDERYYLEDGSRHHGWHGDARLDGGVLYTQFAHFLDLLCWTVGVPGVRYATATNQTHREIHPFADTGMVHFALPGGGLGSLNYSTVVWDRNFESTFTLIGTRGTVKLGGQYMNELRYCHVDGIQPPELPRAAAANHYGGYRGSAANHHHVIDNVVRVLNGEAEVATTAEEGRAVVGLIEAIHAASKPV
jgi:predicted dehydrogenase